MVEPAPPLLSVVVPTYNRAALVPRAVRSILAGTEVALEVVVVDDGSADDTQAAVASVIDDRIRYLRIAHRGVSAARNEGASFARGRWLAFLDSDDEVLPGWANKMVSLVELSGGIGICGGEAIDKAGSQLWEWIPPAALEPLPQALAEMFLPGMFILGRQDFLDADGYVEELAFGENTELALRLLFRRAAPTGAERRVLVRRHVSNSRDTYSESRVASARYVLASHPWLRQRLPRLCASYHALIGVDEARRGNWTDARREFLTAARSRPAFEHVGRLLVAALPLVRSRAWPATHTGAYDKGQRP